jgi:hypothetical protein
MEDVEMKLGAALVLAILAFSTPALGEENPTNITIGQLLEDREKFDGEPVRVKGLVEERIQVSGPEGHHVWVTLKDGDKRIKFYHFGTIDLNVGKETVFAVGRFAKEMKTKSGAEKNVIDVSPGRGKVDRIKAAKRADK